MELKTTNREQLINEILDAEWRMFQQVRSATPASCQSRPEAFRTIRGSVFQLWPEAMLLAYRNQLDLAERSGRNLLTEKYARMDNLIGPVSTNPLIEKIVAIEQRWQTELREKLPALYRRTCRNVSLAGDGSNFAVYLRSELETYGDEVLTRYYCWVTGADEQGENISLTMLSRLTEKGGFNSLDQAEHYFAARQD